MTRKPKQISKKRRNALAEAFTKSMINFVEAIYEEPLPVPKMEDELYAVIEDWIDEFESEAELKWKLENNWRF